MTPDVGRRTLLPGGRVARVSCAWWPPTEFADHPLPHVSIASSYLRIHGSLPSNSRISLSQEKGSVETEKQMDWIYARDQPPEPPDLPDMPDYTGD
jgi:hypothetical protein